MDIRLRASLAAVALAVGACSSLFGATFVVPPDQEMVRRAGAIVIATALPSYAEMTETGGIATVTPMTVEEVIRGRVPQMINVFEPGGTFGNVSMNIPGVPRFATGERMLLLLTQTAPQRWSVTDLALGKFTYVRDMTGEALLVRDAAEIAGFAPDLSPHVEPQRLAEPFERFVRIVAAGGAAKADYFVDGTSQPRRITANTSTGVLPAATFTATSYSMLISGSRGSRWNVFPNGLLWYTVGTEPGAPGNGVTAVQTAIASWNNDAGSNVNYVYGGADTTHTQGLHGPDGANTVLFERDLSSWGVSPFTCSGSSYGGTLGLGGITSASGSNTVNGETFVTTNEGDVEMNRGIANCSLLFSSGNFNSAVTHEIGHTLGFRHSDQDRGGTAPCSNDASLECATTAIMRSSIPSGLNGALQAWDQNAVRAIYPGTTAPPPPPPCTPPSITTQPASTTITSGSSATLTAAATGTAPLSHQWFTGTSGSGTAISGATGSSLTVTPASTTSYWVRVTNSCGTANSATATVTVVAASAGSGVRGDLTGDGKPDVLWSNQTNGTVLVWIMNGITRSSSATITTEPNRDWQIRAMGDFNRDGHNDLVWHQISTGRTVIWRMNGLAYVGTVEIERNDPAWDIVAAGDLTGDGNVDVLWRHMTDGRIVLWGMNGFTRVSTTSLGQEGVKWVIKAIADMTGDGRNDVVWQDNTDGRIVVWQMNGTTMTAIVHLGNETAVWQIRAVADYDRNGSNDVIWQNTNDGRVVLWIMSGPTHVSTVVIGTEPTNWLIVGPK